MFDYGLLPPEVNSGRIYTGPGVGPMLAAATAWAGLAADVQTAATGHRSVISELTSGPWQGPASAAALTAVSPFIIWLDSSAEQAAQAATHALAAAAAYETAFAATVPPPVIAANRALLAALIATNFFGQNTPTIAATEALYLEFWAQDAAAMYTYAANSATATQLTELPEPAEVVDPHGLTNQATTALKSQTSNTYTNIMQTLSQVDARVSGVLQTLSSPINGTAIDQWIIANTPFDDIVPLYSKYLSPYMNFVSAELSGGNAIGNDVGGIPGIANLARELFPATQAVEGAAQAAGAATAGAAANLPGGVGGVAASLGKAIPLGGLSVPASWTTAPGTTNPTVAALTNATTIPATTPAAANGTPVAPPFGQFVNSGRGRKLPSYGFRLTFMTKPPAAG
ncbi:putative PPE family protein PPE32 [Mycobacterium attenuatum]|uniref:Putative PPE family protein PPE32 n=1 Tax=Mycobacterium attenuatum TaxID=2341086 RepID=A0A498PNF8_9MYCO|nr:PPE family protein [Mycobacterium attenuatum]VBA32739.1 putative PPE family protein PPE32 [Mycobacterium attenuatum]VBA32745.1 putative PPE family protein PPE32 [Mycobacterium attenuatum]